MSADDDDETGRPIDNSGLAPKPPGAKTGAPVPPGVAPSSPPTGNGRNFTFTAELFGVGTMLDGDSGGGKTRAKRPVADNRPFFNPTGDDEVDAHYEKTNRLTDGDKRIHTQLDRDNGIDEDGRDLDRFNAPQGQDAVPDERLLDRFNERARAGEAPDERNLDRFNEPGARQVPEERDVDEDGPGNRISDEFNRRRGPGGP